MIVVRLQGNVQHVADLVRGTLRRPLPSLDGHEEFVEVPGVAPATLPSLEGPGVFGPEITTSRPDGFVADDDPALSEEVFNTWKGPPASVAEPNGMA